MITDAQIFNAKILIVDDQNLHILTLEKILKKSGYCCIHSTNDPTEAAGIYQEIDPDLVILDLNMPKMDGFEVMKQLSAIEEDGYLPILIISEEKDQKVRHLALSSGAKDFIDKPFDPIEVIMRIQNMIQVRLLHKHVHDQNKILEDKVKARTQDLYNTKLDVIERLARAIEYRDSETGMHIIRMSHYAACLAAKVGMSMEECELLLTASPLHDVGKIGIPDSILRKPGPLSPEEWNIMKTHTTIGAELLSGSNSKFLLVGKEIALTHHEKWDGSGYPKGLKGEEIPLIGRICCLCDVFDALMTKRPYKEAWIMEDTLKEIEKGANTLFEASLVKDFLEILPQIKHIREKYNDQIPEEPLTPKE